MVMRKNLVFFYYVFLILSTTLILVPQTLGQPENVKVLSHNWYINSADNFVVVGELQNVGPNIIRSVFLTGGVYTKDGELRAVANTQAFVNQLLPQQEAPFYLEFNPFTSLTGDLFWVFLGVDHVEFTVTKAEVTSEYQYPDLALESSSGAVDQEGVYWVGGSLRNVGSQIASNIRVIGTFYNSSGSVIAVGFTEPLDPISLSPSSSASFRVGAFDLNQSIASQREKISSYKLLIQTREPLLTGTSPPTLPPTSSPPPQNPILSTETIYVIIGILVVIGIISTLIILRRKAKP
jgi:hypothetical protein